MATPTMVQHLRTTNDTNGNPRRIYLLMTAEGTVTRAIDEGYGNPPSEYGILVQLPSVNITPAEYRRTLKRWGN